MRDVPACPCDRQGPPAPELEAASGCATEAVRHGSGCYHRRSMFHALAIAPLVLLLAGCPRNEPQLATPIEEEGEVVLLSTVNVADPRAEDQLLSGFHGVEQRAWRWSEKSFSVALQPPPAEGGQPVHLDLKFTVPDVVIDKVGPVTLSATVNGRELGSETYAEAGQHFLFTREIPADTLASGTARVDFEVDKALPPSELDTRELAVIISSIALK